MEPTPIDPRSDLLTAVRDAIPGITLTEWKIRAGPGEAVFLADGTPFELTPRSADPQGNGINVVSLILDPYRTETVVSASGSFDTAGPNGPSEAEELRTFLDGPALTARVMLGAIKSKADTTPDLRDRFQQRGSRLLDQVGAGDGWAFVGVEWHGTGIAVAEQRMPQGTAEIDVHIGTVGRLRVPPDDVSFIRALMKPLGGPLDLVDVLVVVTAGGDDAHVEVFGALAHDRYDGVPVRVTLRRRAASRQAQEGNLEGVLRTIFGPGKLEGLFGSLKVPACFDLRPLLVYASNTDRTGEPYRDPGADLYLNRNEGGPVRPPPTNGRYGRGIPLVKGLTLFAPLPRTEAITGAPEVVTRPLQAALGYLDVDGGDVEVTLGADEATLLVRLDGTQSFIDTDPLEVTFRHRQAGFLYGRPGEPGAENAPLRETGRRPADDAAAKAMTVHVEADADVAVAFDRIGALGFPKDDTARMTLGLVAASGGSVTGWMRLRDDAAPWTEPFGIPGLTVSALYTAIDLAQRKLQAFFGDAEVAGVEAQLAVRIAEKRGGNLTALRLVDDLPVFGWLGAMAGVSVPDAVDGIRLKGMGSHDSLDGEALDPADYNVYVVPTEQDIDGKTFPAGFRFHGTLELWTIGLTADLTLTREDDGTLRMQGAALGATVADVGGISLGLAGEDLPVELAVDAHGQVYGRVPYHLDILGLSLSGDLIVTENGPTFVKPGTRPIGQAEFRVTRLDAGPDLSRLALGAEATYEWRVSAKDLSLPDGLTALPPIGELEAQATLALTVADGALTAEVTGRVSGLGDLPSMRLTVSRDDMADPAAFLEKVYEDAIQDLVRKLADPLGNLPILGDALRFFYGLDDGSVGRLLTAADHLGVTLPSDIEKALGDAGLGNPAGIASDAVDWARKVGLPIGGGVGGWAADAVPRGWGLAKADEWVRYVPGVKEAFADLAAFADTVGRAASKGADSLVEVLRGGGGFWPPDLASAAQADADPCEIFGLTDAGHDTVARAGLALLFTDTDYDGTARAYPLGSYPRLEPNFRSVLLPRGWMMQFFMKPDFQGPSVTLTQSTDESVAAVFRSMKVLPLDQVLFFEDHHFEGNQVGTRALVFSNPLLMKMSSMLVPPGWKVRLRNDDNRMLTFCGSVDSLAHATDAFYESRGLDVDSWNDDVVEAWLTIPPRRLIDWRGSHPAMVDRGRTDPGAWTTAEHGKGIRTSIAIPGTGESATILASLAGNDSHYLANGVNAIYLTGDPGPGQDHYGVSVEVPGDWLTPEKAKAMGWHVQWIAFRDTEQQAPRAADPFAAGTSYFGGTGTPYGDDALTTSVPTGRRWRPGENPPMLVALTGVEQDSRHPVRMPDVLGAGAAYRVRPEGADVYLRLAHGGDEYWVSKWEEWGMAWIRPRFGERGTIVPTGRGRARFASGATPPGEGWEQYVDENGVTHPDTITLRIDTSRAGFQGMPIFVSQIAGDSSHWTTTGASAIYAPSADGFRVYVRQWAGGDLTPDQAREWNWSIQWIGVDG